MDLSLYKRIVDQIKSCALRINFGDWGEPTMNPDIFAMFAYALENRIATSASTNLHVFKTEEQIRNLAVEGPTWNLNISLHGASQETYASYQPGRDFHDTIDKVKTLKRILKEEGKTRPTMALVFAITKKNQHEIPAMKQLARELGGTCRMYTASINVRFYDDSRQISQLIDTWMQDTGWDQFDNFDFVNKTRIEAFHRAIRENSGVDLEKLEQQKLTGRYFCDDPWRSLTVNWDGTVSLCCVDYTKHRMGDTREGSLPDIWNNRQYQDVRAYLLQKIDDLPDGCPCVHCVRY